MDVADYLGAIDCCQCNQTLQEQENNLLQSIHESVSSRNHNQKEVICDQCLSKQSSEHDLQIKRYTNQVLLHQSIINFLQNSNQSQILYHKQISQISTTETIIIDQEDEEESTNFRFEEDQKAQSQIKMESKMQVSKNDIANKIQISKKDQIELESDESMLLYLQKLDEEITREQAEIAELENRLYKQYSLNEQLYSFLQQKENILRNYFERNWWDQFLLVEIQCEKSMLLAMHLLQEHFHIEFENDTALINNVNLIEQSLMPVWIILRFLALKYPEYSESVSISLANETILHHGSSVRMERIGHCLKDSVWHKRRLDILLEELYCLYLHMSKIHYEITSNSISLPFEVVMDEEGHFQINGLAVEENEQSGSQEMRLEKKNQLVLKYMVYDVKCLLMMEYYKINGLAVL